MKARFLAAPLCALTAVACAPARAPLDANAVPATLRPGPHEVMLNGVRHYYRAGGNAPAEAPPVVFLYVDEADRFAREVTSFVRSR